MNCEYITSHCTWICLAFGRKNLLVSSQGFFASTWHKHHFLFWTFTFFSYHHFSLTFHQLLKCFNKNGDSLKKENIFTHISSFMFKVLPTVVKLLLKRFFAKGKMGKKSSLKVLLLLLILIFLPFLWSITAKNIFLCTSIVIPEIVIKKPLLVWL